MPTSPGGQPLASFLDRFLAYLIDSAILSAVSTVLSLPLMFFWFMQMDDMLAATTPTVNPDGTLNQPAPGDFFADFLGPYLLFLGGIMVLSLIVTYIYHVEMMFRSGQTIGKRVMKLRVVPLAPEAELTRGMAVRRYLVQSVAPMVLFFLFVFAYLDGLWQLWDKPYQQCLHDKFAKTVVVKVPG